MTNDVLWCKYGQPLLLRAIAFFLPAWIRAVLLPLLFTNLKGITLHPNVSNWFANFIARIVEVTPSLIGKWCVAVWERATITTEQGCYRLDIYVGGRGLTASSAIFQPRRHHSTPKHPQTICCFWCDCRPKYPHSAWRMMYSDIRMDINHFCWLLMAIGIVYLLHTWARADILHL